MDELGKISTAILDVDCRLQEILFILEQMEIMAEDSRNASCYKVLSVMHYYLTHVESELNEWGNKLDMYWLRR